MWEVVSEVMIVFGYVLFYVVCLIKLNKFGLIGLIIGVISSVDEVFWVVGLFELFIV